MFMCEYMSAIIFARQRAQEPTGWASSTMLRHKHLCTARNAAQSPLPPTSAHGAISSHCVVDCLHEDPIVHSWYSSGRSAHRMKHMCLHRGLWCLCVVFTTY